MPTSAACRSMTSRISAPENSASPVAPNRRARRHPQAVQRLCAVVVGIDEIALQVRGQARARRRVCLAASAATPPRNDSSTAGGHAIDVGQNAVTPYLRQPRRRRRPGRRTRRARPARHAVHVHVDESRNDDRARQLNVRLTDAMARGPDTISTMRPSSITSVWPALDRDPAARDLAPDRKTRPLITRTSGRPAILRPRSGSGSPSPVRSISRSSRVSSARGRARRART